MKKPSFRKTNSGDNEKIAVYSNEKISAGKIRKTQLITTFGVGSIVDFKNYTVVIASTDDWDYNSNDDDEIDKRKIYNENLSAITDADYFLTPRTSKNTNSVSGDKNVRSYIFPEKLYCSKCGNIYDYRELDIKGQIKCPKCKNALNASRFIVVCPNGHMDDFPYDWWVHNGKPCPSGVKSPRIKMRNISNRTDIESLRVECTECKATRSMVQALACNELPDYPCTCKNPHFKDPLARASFGCHEKMSVRLRSGAGVYFPITKSALLIPPWSRKLMCFIMNNYDFIEVIDDEPKQINAIRRKLHDDSVADAEIKRSLDVVKNYKEHKRNRTENSVIADEYAVLSNRENSEGNFSSYSANVPEKYGSYFEQIAVVDQLTVTQAFTGFTRITRDENKKVPISQYPKPWLPAVELKGEGIFIRFNKERVIKWMNINSSHYKMMHKAMKDSKLQFDSFSSVYVMLHTFAHLFIREISNSCGYSAASIREKIYSEVNEETGDVKMCGILVYVSSADSDGSLGGLISIADDENVFENIVNGLLERASWCSADPLCILSTKQGYKNLNYAACHDCTLLPETSCEKFNCFLDRASIVGLPDNPSLGFFR